jgi:type I restriction enzyme S subunit
MVHVTKGKFEETEVLVPPADEQYRIVAKIETLFSELDKGIEALKTAREQLKVYRQAVLKHAFEGNLTAQWREQNKDKLESPEQLLARIQQERQARYQQQLQDWQTAVKAWEKNGKEGKKPGKPREQKIIHASSDEFDQLASLPNGWSWVLLNELAEHIVDGTHKTPTYRDTGIHFISAKDIKNFKIDFSNTRYIDMEQHKELTKRCMLRIGSVLITKSGTIGRVAIVETDAEFSLFESVANVPILPPANSYYISLSCYFLIDTYFGEKNQKGVAVRHLHLEDIRRLPVPLPSILEQVEISKRLDDIFSVIEHQEKIIADEVVRAETLRQSILKKAFSGQLVPQDPNDEPASALLERILAEKSEKAASKTTNKRAPAKRVRKANSKEVS